MKIKEISLHKKFELKDIKFINEAEKQSKSKLYWDTPFLDSV